MISIQINDVKGFMSKLLKQEVFDRFLVHHLELQLNYKVEIDGEIPYVENEIDITQSDAEAAISYISWEHIRENIFLMLKKHTTPKLLKISFLMNEKTTTSIIHKISNSNEGKNITGFVLNIVFENNTLKIVTATNYKSFTLDKSYEQYFDESIIKFLNKNGIE